MRRWANYLDECRCFFIDSLTEDDDTGQLADLVTWLQDTVGDVVCTQGRAVPAYWEIAQDMVDMWTRQSQAEPDRAPAHQMTQMEFAGHLEAAIARRMQDDADDRFARLRAAIDAKTFELSPDRIRRTLRFLTHSGWIYWDEALFESRVIIGQQWALDGLYAILDRRHGSAVFRELTDTDGRFALSDLGRLAWNCMGYSAAEQQLLLSYMEQCNLCFKLRSAEEAWREEAVYASFEHLPTADDARLVPAFRRWATDRGPAKARLTSRLLHKLHWQQFLVSAGATFGAAARYAHDGLLVRNEDGQDILVLFNPEAGGLGGDIVIEVQGPNALERLEDVKKHVEGFLPDNGRTPADTGRAMGASEAQLEVFISYAWNRPGSSDDYEEAVDRLAELLGPAGVHATGSTGYDERTGHTLVRDRDFMKTGDSIVDFMKYGANRPYVIVVHSEKYWRSPDCMYELMEIDRSLRDQHGRSRRLNVIPVAHPSSRIARTRARDEYLEHWKHIDDLPARIPDPAILLDGVPGTIRAWSRDLSADAGYDIQWPATAEEQEVALKQVQARLLPAPSPT